jgi:hypothetical protein
MHYYFIIKIPEIIRQGKGAHSENQHAMKVCIGSETQLHAFPTYALDGV